MGFFHQERSSPWDVLGPRLSRRLQGISLRSNSRGTSLLPSNNSQLVYCCVVRYYSRLTMDFQTNKRICEEVAMIPSKHLRNQIAGFITHLMKRIQRGPVRGISLKLQEEERERR